MKCPDSSLMLPSTYYFKLSVFIVFSPLWVHADCSPSLMFLLLLWVCIVSRVFMHAYLCGCAMFVHVPAEEGVSLHGTEGKEGCKLLSVISAGN